MLLKYSLDIVENFCNIWSPCKNIATDEGTVPFKGRIHFKCYNPNKPISK